QNHWQSVQRLHADGGRYLFLARSFNLGSGPVPMAAIVALPSRAYFGEALGSNLPLSAADKVVATMWAEWTPGGSLFQHAGGSQVAGDYVAVPLEDGRWS